MRIELKCHFHNYQQFMGPTLCVTLLLNSPFSSFFSSFQNFPFSSSFQSSPFSIFFFFKMSKNAPRNNIRVCVIFFFLISVCDIFDITIKQNLVGADFDVLTSRVGMLIYRRKCFTYFQRPLKTLQGLRAV